MSISVFRIQFELRNRDEYVVSTVNLQWNPPPGNEVLTSPAIIALWVGGCLWACQWKKGGMGKRVGLGTSYSACLHISVLM